MFYKDKYLILFSNCIPVKGARRSIICDLQRFEFKFIPNDLFFILERPPMTTMALLDEYGKENEVVLLEYINFILDFEYGFLGQKEDVFRFPKLDMKFSTPYHITNMILEINEKSNYINKNLIIQIQKLGCKNIQILSYKALEPSLLRNILENFNSSIIKHLEIYIKESDYLTNEFLADLSKKHLRLNTIIIHSSVKNKHQKLQLLNVYRTKTVINNFSYCGIVNHNLFSLNLKKFIEAKNFNSCLYKKISIDKKGDIRNCPAIPLSFGNIKTTPLEEVINNKGFKKYWYITKDQIEVCKDCEFRYICTDCRAYTETPNNMFSKPLKCGYDPYSNEWTDWVVNPQKKSAIKYYNIES